MTPVAELEAVAVELRTRLSEATGAEFVTKDTHLPSLAVAQALDVGHDVKATVERFGVDLSGLRFPTGSSFLRDFATTYARTVATPSHWSELERLLVDPHEAQHVVQHNEGVDAGWWPRDASHSVLYLAGVVARTAAGSVYVGKVEGDGYAVTQAMRVWLTGRPRPLSEVIEQLAASYNLLQLGTATAEGVLRSHYATMRNGLVPNITCAKIATDLLNERVPHLRGRFGVDA